MKIFIEYEELDKRVELLIPGHYRLKKIKVGLKLSSAGIFGQPVWVVGPLIPGNKNNLGISSTSVRHTAQQSRSVFSNGCRIILTVVPCSYIYSF